MVSLTDVLLAMSNIPVSDPIAEIWGRGLQGGYKIIEYTGTLPITITADGTALIDYCIYGNTEQTGTPTPENPVDVVGCGVRTVNLFDFNANNPDNGYVYGKQLSSDGSIYTFQQTDISEYISITPFSLYTFSYGSQYNEVYAALYNAKREFVRSIKYNVQKVITFYSHEDETYLRITYLRANKEAVYVVEGSIPPKPYEPYGYKLPMTVSDGNAMQTVPVYLGEVKTTRRIKKLVLTGKEGWTITTNGILRIGLSGQLRPLAPLCTHYLGSDSSAWSNVPDKSVTVSINGYLAILDTTYTTTSDFKSYLAQQYAAGTPVTVWYILAKPETGIVNEPLMKIGDYADTLSMEQAGASIPTFVGSTVIDYDGDPKPSQMYIKYRR